MFCQRAAMLTDLSSLNLCSMREKRMRLADVLKHEVSLFTASPSRTMLTLRAVLQSLVRTSMRGWDLPWTRRLMTLGVYSIRE